MRKQPLVNILTFCLMPNHYHLMVRQQTNGGITEFMRKLGTGYTNYFNIKYQRVGPLFQGKFKAVRVSRDAHLTHLPHYIHLNPLDITMPEWRGHQIHNPQKAIDFLHKYRWSGLHDYLGKKTFPSITDRNFLKEYIGGPKAFSNAMREWIRAANFDLIYEVTLE